MADNSDTPKAAAPRKTMAPAARPPAGADDAPDERPADERVADAADMRLAKLSDAELDALEAEVRSERTRRARRPGRPSFGMSEGERAELELRGATTSPWNGERITGDGEPRS